MKPEAPKFIVVYQDNPNGYCYSLRNSKNEYASIMTDKGPFKRTWRTAIEAELYITKWADSSLVWVAYTEWTPPINHVTTALTHKPAHGGYPNARRLVGGSSWPNAARTAAKQRAFSALYGTDPLVWPVIPQADDGSSEEPTTVPDILVQALAQRVFIARLRNILRGY